MPEPHPAEVRLAALRALLRIMSESGNRPAAQVDAPPEFTAALLAGANDRQLCVAVNRSRDEVIATLTRIACG